MKLDKRGSSDVWGPPSSAGAKGGVVFLIIGIIAFVVVFGIFSTGIPFGCDEEAGACSIAPNPFLKRYIGNLLLGSRSEGEADETSLGEINIMTLISNPSAYAQQASAMWREPEETHVLQTDKPYAAIEFPSRTITLSENSLSEQRAAEYGVYARFQIKNSGDAEITNMTVLFNFTTTEVNDPTRDPPVEFYCNAISEDAECPSGYTITPSSGNSYVCEEDGAGTSTVTPSCRSGYVLYGNKCGTNKITLSLLRSGETEEVRCGSIKIFGSSGDTYGIRAKVYVNYHQTGVIPIMFINESYSKEMQFTGQENELKSQAKYMCSACPNACCWINSYGVGEFFGEVRIPIIADDRTESINPMIKNAGDGDIIELLNVVYSIPNELAGSNDLCSGAVRYTDLQTYAGVCTAQGCVCQDSLYQQVMSDLCTELGTCECIERISGGVTKLPEYKCPYDFTFSGVNCTSDYGTETVLPTCSEGYVLSGIPPQDLICNEYPAADPANPLTATPTCPVGYIADTARRGICVPRQLTDADCGTGYNFYSTIGRCVNCGPTYDYSEGRCKIKRTMDVGDGCDSKYILNDNICAVDPSRVITDNVFVNKNTAQAIHELDSNYQFCSYENVDNPLSYTAMSMTLTKPTTQMNNSRLDTYMVRGDMSYVYVKTPTTAVVSIV